jgi:DNA-binding transcriptional regulator YhcF (GntR family)
MRLVPNSLHDEVAAQLRERIFDGELSPGTFLDEVRLAEQLKISRTPLREALKVLTAEGLVRHEPRRGCFVNEVTEQDLDEIFPVIGLLEGRCAYEAAQHASDADIETLEQLHQKLARHAKARRINEYYEANFAIHEAIIPLAGRRDRRPAQDPAAGAPAAAARAGPPGPEPVRTPGRLRGAQGTGCRRRRGGDAHAPAAAARGAARTGAGAALETCMTDFHFFFAKAAPQ